MNLLNYVGIDEKDLVKVLRLGRPTENSKARPIRAILSNPLLAKKIVSSKNKVEALGFKVGCDRTKLQQYQLKQAVDKLRSRSTKGETNLLIKYFGGVPSVVKNN
ncbi:hypothetical protein JTB14_029306 [Gonioctena quinquepunctata]|nr:hypothetical protein JTB14_029306 [Gonioctena quinquepunctata]